MGVLNLLSVLTLRKAAEGALEMTGLVAGERTVEQIVQLLRKHFADHSQLLSAAMRRACGNAWRALEVVLAGETLWNWLDSGDQKAFRAQVQALLDGANLAGHGEEFRAECLKELRLARKHGFLDGPLDPAAPHPGPPKRPFL